MKSREFGPITRHMLALYAGGSGDHNPLHVDIDFARDQAGMPDVIGHGMLTMAYMGRLIEEEFSDGRVLSFETRFESPSAPGDRVICEAIAKQGDDPLVTVVAITARTQDGRTLATGEATLGRMT